MPELPEVETMRRGIAPIVGGTIARVLFPRGPCKPIQVEPEAEKFRRRTRGKQVVGVDRLGKRVVVRLDSTDAIVFEPRMTGLVLLADPPDPEHVRVVIALQNASVSQLLFWDRRGLGTVRLLTRDQQQANLGSQRLGPDALGIDCELLASRFRSSDRPIKVALLDQVRLAGIGNLYASEILFESGIHPAIPCSALTAAAWKRLHAAMQLVLNDAIRHEGSTLGDGTYRNALNQSGSYQNHHRVYQRKDEICMRCARGTIQRIVQAQRSTFFCPRCQSHTTRGRKK